MNIVKNKNGFTLVELLAVIVILAVIILIATSNVLSNLEKGRRSALAVEGNTLVKDSATTAYQLGILDGTVTTGSVCYSLEYLHKNDYFSKGASDNYTGSVLVSVPADGKGVTYKFWISNGSYVISDKSVGASGNDAEPGTSASNNCGGASVTLFS